MASLSKKEIESTILAKGFEPVDIAHYKNLKSPLTIRCKAGHEFSTSMEQIRKDRFVCVQCDGAATRARTNLAFVPDKKGFRVVALDQASNNLGVSVFDEGKLVYYEAVMVSGELMERIYKVFKYVEDRIEKWKPDLIGFEDIQYQQNPQTYKILGMVLGACVVAAEKNKIPHVEVLNGVWQSQFNIGGADRHAQKANVVKRVKDMYDLIVTDDVADAILLGRYVSIKNAHRYERVLF